MKLHPEAAGSHWDNEFSFKKFSNYFFFLQLLSFSSLYLFVIVIFMIVCFKIVIVAIVVSLILIFLNYNLTRFDFWNWDNEFSCKNVLIIIFPAISRGT